MADKAIAKITGTALVVLLACLPVFVTAVVPLVDFYPHVTRFFVLAGGGQGTPLAESYQVHWALLPNIGFDAVGAMFMAVLPPMGAAKLSAVVTILVPMLGTIYLSHAVHGRTTLPTVIGAAIVAHSSILIWGFLNFLLALGLMLFALGLWIRQKDRPGLQYAAAFMAGPLILLSHGFGFLLWGLCLGMVELALIIEDRRLTLAHVVRRALVLASLAVLPLILFLMMPTAHAEGGGLKSLSNFQTYVDQGQHWVRLWGEALDRLDWFLRVANSTYPTFDSIIGLLMWAGMAFAVWRRWLPVHRRLIPVILLAALLMAVTPPTLFSSGHLPKRIPLLFLALLVASFDFARVRAGSPVVLALVALFAIRIAATTVGWASDGKRYDRFLSVLQSHQTGAIGAAYFAPDFDREMHRPNCSPLAPLMSLINGTAIPTFASALQQPLTIVGPLAAAMDKLPPAIDDAPPNDAISAYQAAGFESLLICADAPVALPDNVGVIAQDGPWMLLALSASAGDPK